MRSRSRQSIRIARRSLSGPTKLQRSPEELITLNRRNAASQTLNPKTQVLKNPQGGINLHQISIFSSHPQLQSAPAPAPKTAKPRYGAVRLVNKFNFDLRYLYQWGKQTWKEIAVPANGSRWHAWKYSGSQPVSPDFKVKFDCDLGGKIEPKTYTLQKYQSEGEPHTNAKPYEFLRVSSTHLDLLPQEKIQDQQWKQVDIQDKEDGKKASVKKYTYSTAKIKGEAFVKGKYDSNLVDPNDVEQGQIANCYLLAAMASVARANPDAIQRLIRPKGNGVYDVTIYINPKPNAKPGEGPRTPLVITVDDTFPVSSAGKEVFAQRGDINAQNQPELWVMLIEKAYATYKGSYNSTAWGNPDEAMSMLTGNNSDTYYSNKFNDQQTAKIIDNALSKKLPVTASTPAMSDTLQEEAKKVNPNIAEKHAYSVKRVDVSSLSIDLQNPWGGSYDVNRLPISKFRQFYEKYQINR